MIRTFVAVHHHEFGITVWPFKAEVIPSDLVKLLGINVEYDKDEYIDIEELHLENIPDFSEVKV